MSLQLPVIQLSKLAQIIRVPRLWRILLAHRVLAGAEHRQILARGFRTVVDVGANRGQFSLAARKWAPGARIISLEPLPCPAAIFNKIFRGDPMVTLHQAAIGPVAGSVPIHVSAKDDSSSILPISALQLRLYPGTHEVRTEAVRIGRLIEFVSPEEIVQPALLKLDVQGYELKALIGCEELLERFSFVYAECSFVELYTGQSLADEVIAWLAKRNFRLSGLYNTVYDRIGNAIQSDLLFAKNA
jgi:FkbM family methyltransferase